LAPADGYAGRYRDVNIRLCGTEHIPPDYDEIDQQLGFLLAGYQTGAALLLTKAAQLHAGLTHIHPFRNGNGQVARILTNYVLQEHGWPPVNLTAGNAVRYLNALDIYDRKGDSQPLARLLQEEMAGEIKTFLALYKQHRRQGM
jgi:Fic family protein